jgi:two-component system copper resistance phosphate regulon response regulator CusR
MRILVVEDEPTLADLVRESLTNQGHTVVWKSRGSEAVSEIRERNLDLVLLDLTLPDMDGLDILREVRSDHPSLGVLILSGRGEVSDRVTGLNLGADDYLTKPFSVEELIARVHVFDRRRTVSPDAVLRVGDLTLNRIERTVTRNAQPISLTRREFALLEFLMLNAGKTLTRAEITSRVWSEEKASPSNVVDVYINYLRKKVDGDSTNPLIHTARGKGYRVGDDKQGNEA